MYPCPRPAHCEKDLHGSSFAIGTLGQSLWRACAREQVVPGEKRPGAPGYFSVGPSLHQALSHRFLEARRTLVAAVYFGVFVSGCLFRVLLAMVCLSPRRHSFQDKKPKLPICGCSHCTLHYYVTWKHYFRLFFRSINFEGVFKPGCFCHFVHSFGPGLWLWTGRAGFAIERGGFSLSSIIHTVHQAPFLVDGCFCFALHKRFRFGLGLFFFPFFSDHLDRGRERQQQCGRA